MFLPKSSFSVSEVRCCPGNCLPARRQSLSHLLCLSCEGVGAELSSRMWEWERKGNWGMIVLETWGGCLQVFRFGKGDIHGDLWGLQCNQPTAGKSCKVLRISLSSWSLKWTSSLLSLLPINPGLGSWRPPTGSGRTQWPHTKFIAYSIALGGDIKYFWGGFRLGIPRGYWQWHTYPDTLSPCSEACRRRGLVCSTSEQSPKDRCCSRCCLWQGVGYLCLMHLQPGFSSAVRSICLRSLLFSFYSVKTPQPWLVALLGSLILHLRASLRASAKKTT